MTFNQPQPAPFAIGTRLQRIRKNGTMSGAIVDGKTLYFDRDGNTGSVVRTDDRAWIEHDSETGEPYCIHGYSVIQFDDDKNGVFGRCIDVDNQHEWKVIA